MIVTLAFSGEKSQGYVLQNPGSYYESSLEKWKSPAFLWEGSVMEKGHPRGYRDWDFTQALLWVSRTAITSPNQLGLSAEVCSDIWSELAKLWLNTMIYSLVADNWYKQTTFLPCFKPVVTKAFLLPLLSPVCDFEVQDLTHNFNMGTPSKRSLRKNCYILH